MQRNGKLALVDGYAHIYRSFYAIPNLTNSRGEPTNALYAMARYLLKLDQDLPHEYGAVVLDKGRSHKRLNIYPEYKETRPPMPDLLQQQIAKIRTWMEACGWVIVEKEGHEADDLIAAIVNVCHDCETYVISHDKDLAQLVRSNVSLMIPAAKSTYDCLDVAGVKAKFGVSPKAIVDYLALMGDSVDNIPGIAGVGPKTAANLLDEFGSIDALLANLNAVSSKVREKIAANAELLRRNQQLVALDLTLPDDWTCLEALRRRKRDWDRMIAIARENDFKSFVPTLQKAKQEAENPTLF